MRLFQSIEERYGVDEPGYQPPTDDEEYKAPDETDFGALEVVGSLLIPIAGVAFAIMRFVREEVGKGLACLLIAGLGILGWLIILGALSGGGAL